MIVAHVSGLPIEEGLLQLMPVAATLAAGAALVARRTFDRARRLRRHGTSKNLEGGHS